MKCAECSAKFKPKQLKSCFCTPACKIKFHNRCKSRGGLLVPMVMASRQGRDTEIGRFAQVEWARLAARFTAEDKAAGRMSMLDFFKRQQAQFLKAA